MLVCKNLNCYKMANNGQISIVKISTGAYGYSASNYHFRILIKAPKDPKNPLLLDLPTIKGGAAIFAIFATRRFRWPMATLLLALAEGWGTLRVPRLVWTQLKGHRPPL